MAKMTKDELVNAIAELTVLELSELVKAIEEKFGVKAAAPAVAVAAAPAAGGPAKALKSPLPGSITKILVTPGQAVKKGETLLMMEAMKMENEIKAEKDGVVAEIKVSVGQNVMNDDVLLTIA